MSVSDRMAELRAVAGKALSDLEAQSLQVDAMQKAMKLLKDAGIDTTDLDDIVNTGVTSIANIKASLAKVAGIQPPPASPAKGAKK